MTKHNLAGWDRIARVIGALALAFVAWTQPLSPVIRIAAFAMPAAVLALTAFVGTCPCYRLMGVSTCSTRS
jgi:hypothetical protein